MPRMVQRRWFPEELIGSRVVLRRHVPGNIAAFQRWYADPEIARLARYQATPMRPEEIERIEEHRFDPLDFLYWRESELDFAGVEALIRSLERRPVRREVRAAPEAIDLAVLKILAGDPEVPVRASSPELARRLWGACGLPDFRKTGPEHHARLAAEAGVMIVCNTDAHGVDTLDNMRYAVATARRAWLAPTNVANTRAWREFSKLRKRTKAPNVAE